MSLDYQLGKIRNWKEVSEGDEWVVTEVLIWDCMGMGMRGITEANVDEWLFRYAARHQVGMRGSLREGGEHRNPTEEEIRRRIGLTTNASQLTRYQYMKRLSEYVSEQAESRVRAAQRARKQEA